MTRPPGNPYSVTPGCHQTVSENILARLVCPPGVAPFTDIGNPTRATRVTAVTSLLACWIRSLAPLGNQHFNTGPSPSRYLAFKYEGVAVRNAQGVPKSWISSRIGGDQIDYADEIDVVRSRFAEALSEHGISHDMNQFYEAELPDLPPKPRALE